MDLAQALAELGLSDAQTLTPDTARRAYMRQVRNHPPERDPEGFQRVRHAYEVVQQLTNHVPFAARSEAVARFSPEPAPAPPSNPEPAPEPAPAPAPAPEPAPAPAPAPEPAPAPAPEPEVTPAPEVTALDPTARLLWREYEIALTSSQTSAVAAALHILYAQGTPLTRVPPAQIAFRTVLELFETGRREAARELLAAFESYVDRTGSAQLGGEAAAKWQILRELAALSKVVKKRLTRSLAGAVASGHLEAAGTELAIERDRQGGNRLATSMKQLAPSLYATLPFGAAEPRTFRKAKTGWYGSGAATLLFLALRVCSAVLIPDHKEYEYTPSPAHVAFADPPPLLPDTPAATPSAAAPKLSDSNLSGSAMIEIAALSSKVEKQYLGGQCAEVVQTWPQYANEMRLHSNDPTIAAAYVFQRNRALSACPDLATELPEQP